MAWNKLPKNFIARNVGMDALDLEAAGEGSAINTAKRNGHGPEHLGRRISKTNRQLDGARKTADMRATANLVADTAKVYKAIVIPQRNLIQG